MADSGTHVSVDGRDIKITNLEKVLYPATGTTKGEVLSYYGAVSTALITHAHDRPATRKRWPDGVDEQSFFEKNLPKHAPAWIERASLEHSNRVAHYPLINDAATLMWLVQGAALELHTPQWTFDVTTNRPRRPDRLVIDLDPGPPAGLTECSEIALRIRDLLAADGLASYPVTSGSKGMQLYASVAGRTDIESTSAYAKALAERLEKELPELALSRMTRADRANKVFVDWSQNHPGKTTIAPYALRGREHPNVAAPRSWEEVAAGGLEQLSFTEVHSRLAAEGDLLSPLR